MLCVRNTFLDFRTEEPLKRSFSEGDCPRSSLAEDSAALLDDVVVECVGDGKPPCQVFGYFLVAPVFWSIPEQVPSSRTALRKARARCPRRARRSLRKLDGTSCGAGVAHLAHFERRHRFFQHIASFGNLFEGGSCFTKRGYNGLLSVVTEEHVHARGKERYVVQIVGGVISDADGIGFIFGAQLPCSQNVQRLTSIYLNRHGCICRRTRTCIDQTSLRLPALEIGDAVVVEVDLEARTVEFSLHRDEAVAKAMYVYGEEVTENLGFCGCILKNSGTTLRFCS